ncbi:MAG: sulfotransferase, partial [Candidatus Natronoplasma sp.]
MVTPIFVLGLERNGTTWLQNILCNHPKIVGAQHQAHWGIKESYICGNILYWGNFEDNDEFIEFLELYSSGDYFKLVEGNKEYFYQNRPEDFADFFFELMDNYAEKKNATYWITKLDSLFYRHEELLDKFLT